MKDASSIIIRTYLDGHNRILAYLQKLTDEQLQWHPKDGNLSIAWHAWHVARWADHLQASIPGMTEELSRRLPPGVQVWDAEKWASRWGLDAARLGFAETGMDMADADARQMVFPAKADLLDYVARTFTAAERAVSAIDGEQFISNEQSQPTTEGIWGSETVGDAVLEHLTHDNRHLGMMECLLGLQGVTGTATQ